MQFIDLKTQYSRLRQDIHARMDRVLEHGQYIMGPEIAELEAELARFTGSRHAIGCASGTDALLMALMALDIGPGDEVITTPFSFAATAEVILLAGATPIYADIDARTYNVRPEAVERAITPRTRAILPVSLYGQCADMTAIGDIAAAHGLPVIEDAAQSFGATQNGRRSCNLSTIGCTSFFPSKPLGCYGDGGACFTNDDDLAARLRQIGNHGQDRRYHHVRLGFNGRLDTLQAAVLLAKLAVFEDELDARDRVAAEYTRLLHGVVETPWVAPRNRSVWAQYTLRVAGRDAFAASLQRAGVPTAVHYPLTLHRQPAFATAALPAGSMPEAERAAGEVVSLPMHPYLTPEDQQTISSAVEEAVAQARISVEPAPK